jgi:hypothetical protein
MRSWRILIGTTIWGVLAVAAVLGTDRASGDFLRPAHTLRRHFLSSPHRVEIVLPAGARVGPGAALRLSRDEAYVTVGQVEAVTERSPDKTAVRARIFPEHARFLTMDTSLELVYNLRTPAWVLKTLLPPRLRTRLQEDLETFVRDNREEFFRVVGPELEATVEEAISILEEDMSAALRRHQADVDAILESHKATTVEKELLPVLKKEAWPIIEDRSRPLLEKVGKELWEKLPMWDLGWRWVAGKVPFTRSDMAQKRFKEYVSEEAVPVLTAHTEDFVDLAADIFRRLLKNSRISAALRRSLGEVAKDPAVRKLLEAVFREAVLDNPRLGLCLSRRLSTPAFTAKLSRFLDRLEPILNRTANAILLDSKGRGINPELVRVLRSQLFGKDPSFFIVKPGTSVPAPSGWSFSATIFDDS